MTARRVVHVSQPVEAGVARVVLDLLQEQRAAGGDVHLVCPPGWLAERAGSAGVPWSPWPASRNPGPSVPGEVLRLRRLLREVGPDLVHLHSSKAGLAGRLALRGELPTVFQPHAWSFAAAGGAQGRAALVWERAGARWTSLLLCCSSEEAEQGRAAGVVGRRLVVPNGVDLHTYATADGAARTAARASLGVPLEAPVAVCVGRLCRQKGQDVAVAAWRQVAAALPGARLLLVGDGPDRAALEAAAGEGVMVLGARDDVAALLPAADLALLPSRWEGLALALLEAMACGLPVVASDVAGAHSTLLSGDVPPGGAVVPVDDADALAAATVLRLQDRQRCRAEGAAARSRVEKAHDVRASTSRIREAYDELLAG